MAKKPDDDDPYAKVQVPSRKRYPYRWAVARTRNGWRRGRRVRRFVGSGLNWVGGSYICRVCHREVPFRRANDHNRMHRARMETPEKLKPISPEERSRRPGQRPPPDPAPRQPSQAKYGPTPTPPPDGQSGQFGRKKIHKQTDGNGNKPKKVDKRRKYRGTTDAIGDDMAGNGNGGAGGQTPGVPSSSAAGAFLNGVKVWCEFQPQTVTELRDHLLAMDAAMGMAADYFHQFGAQAIVARRIHPAVAQPIDAAASDIAAMRHYFSQAYYRFEQIYADRLAYERDQNKPKPDEGLWKNVG